MKLFSRLKKDIRVVFERDPAARSVLEGLDTFADEYASHVHVRVCQAGVGQTVPCETLCPAHVDVPAYIALTAAGDTLVWPVM